jgi:hypothetical protein
MHCKTLFAKQVVATIDWLRFSRSSGNIVGTPTNKATADARRTIGSTRVMRLYRKPKYENSFVSKDLSRLFAVRYPAITRKTSTPRLPS